MIVTILVEIPTTLAAVLSGLLSFFAVAATTKAAVLAIPAAATTTAVIVSGSSFYFSAAVVTAIHSANLHPTYSESAAVRIRRSLFYVLLLILFLTQITINFLIQVIGRKNLSYNISKG